MVNLKAIEKEVEKILKKSDSTDLMDRKKDPQHSKITREWVLKLKPEVDEALQIAALGHDIDRAIEARRIKKENFKDYNEYKKRHGQESAKIMTEVLERNGASRDLIEKVEFLIENHEFGGTEETDILKEADSLTFFNYDIYFYIKERDIEKTKEKIQFMYNRLSDRAKDLVKQVKFEDNEVAGLVEKVIF
jgi:hypothetical protein